MIDKFMWQGRGPARGVSQVACRNFKMSRVGVLSRLHNTVGNFCDIHLALSVVCRYSFERCRYFLAHVACRNLPWQGLRVMQNDCHLFITGQEIVNFGIT